VSTSPSRSPDAAAYAGIYAGAGPADGTSATARGEALTVSWLILAPNMTFTGLTSGGLELGGESARHFAWTGKWSIEEGGVRLQNPVWYILLRREGASLRLPDGTILRPVAAEMYPQRGR
jgi:CubicO group peptidase (beta-lactamase class C family)